MFWKSQKRQSKHGRRSRYAKLRLEGLERRDLCAADSAVQYADVNGDKLPDLVYFDSTDSFGSTVRVGLNNGQGKFNAPGSGIWWEHGPSTMDMLKLADVNGDGKADAIYFDTLRSGGIYVGISDGTSFRANQFNGQHQKWWEHGQSTPGMLQLADVNGDGKADAVYFDTLRSSGIYVGISDGTSFRANQFNGQHQKWWEHGQSTPGMLQLADVNGDGKADAVYFDTFRSSGIYVGISDGTSFRANQFNGQHQKWWEHGASTPDMLKLADVNGDGKADAIYFDTFRSSGIYVGISDGTSFRANQFNGQHQKWWEHGASTPDMLKLADVNGDGKADAIYFDTWRSRGVWVGINDGNSFRGVGTGQWWAHGASEPGMIQYVDVNGDRRADALYYDKWRSEAVWVGIAKPIVGNIRYIYGIPPKNGFDDRGIAFNGFRINFYAPTLTTEQSRVLERAVTRWEQVIVYGLPGISFPLLGIPLFDDLFLNVQVKDLGTLRGRGTATNYRSDSSLPWAGTVELSPNHLNDNDFEELLIHEIGHVLGIGRDVWLRLGLLRDAGSANPVFIGTHATAAFNEYFGLHSSAVPVENEGQAGTRDWHWRQSIFGQEMMVGRGTGPLSRVTIGALEDMGYRVEYSAADPYTPNLVRSATQIVTGVTPNGRRAQFYINGIDQNVYVRFMNGNGSSVGSPSHVPTGTATQIAVGYNVKGGLELFAISGVDRQVYIHHFDANGNPIGGYALVPSGTASQIYVGYAANGSLELYAISAVDNQLYVHSFDASGNPVGGYALATTRPSAPIVPFKDYRYLASSTIGGGDPQSQTNLATPIQSGGFVVGSPWASAQAASVSTTRVPSGNGFYGGPTYVSGGGAAVGFSMPLSPSGPSTNAASSNPVNNAGLVTKALVATQPTAVQIGSWTRGSKLAPNLVDVIFASNDVQ